MNKKITFDEFFKTKGVFIHCNTEKKANKLCAEFDKLGKRWKDNKRYSSSHNGWRCFGENTIYSNRGTIGNIRDFIRAPYPIFEFEDVIFDNPLIHSVTLNDKKKITTVVFTDGDVKMVKCGENDAYSPEMGIVYCMALKYSGLSKTQFKKMVDRLLSKGE